MFDLKYDSFYKDDYNKYYNETIEYKDYIISYVVDCLKQYNLFNIQKYL